MTHGLTQGAWHCYLSAVAEIKCQGGVAGGRKLRPPARRASAAASTCASATDGAKRRVYLCFGPKMAPHLFSRPPSTYVAT